MTNSIYHGIVRDGVIVLSPNSTSLREGTAVIVTPLSESKTGAQTITVSPERKAALLSLIGAWKTETPPTDAAIERLLEESRFEKYG